MLVKLKKGDEIQILAPSSFIDKEEDFIKGIDILKTWGLKIVHNNIPVSYTHLTLPTILLV